MATRDKYNFTQQTDLWGTIKYSDVPSYGSTSVGTTGNAYLVRSFLKEFFPFLDLSVKKTAGGSVNVKIQNYRVKFNFVENGVDKEFILDSRSLERVLEPLFEGQGFDGMTDSTYSIPLPKMYNDDGQDVSYGYGYLFVGNENTDGLYNVNLDDSLKPTAQGRKYLFKVAYISNIGLKDKILEIPEKTIQYIKTKVAINSAVIPQEIYPTPTQTNQSDLVTLEKGDLKVSLTTLEQSIIDFLAEVQNIMNVSMSDFYNKFLTYDEAVIVDKIDNLVDSGVITRAELFNGDTVYYLSETGLTLVTATDKRSVDEIALLTQEPTDTTTAGDLLTFEFINKNLAIFNDMALNAPELLDALGKGIQLVQKLAANSTGELLPFVPLENQQQIEDQLTEEDFDLSEVDLEELDLSGLEDDLELNDDELGDLDLTEFNELADFVESELMPSITPVDIENLDALQKNILMILDKPPAKGKGTLYNEMDQSEIWAEVDETIANEYARFDVQTALDALIGLKLVTALNAVPVDYRLIDDKRTSETIAKIKNEVAPLTSTVLEILRILYRFTGKLSADNIKDDLSNINIILPHKAIFSRLIALRDRGLVQEINTSYGGIVWQITSLGNEYVEKLPKPKTAGQVREEQRQEKAFVLSQLCLFGLEVLL